MSKSLVASFTMLLLAVTGAKAAAPEVVVSIKPIHSLVAAVMAGVAEPGLIVEGAASPHTYSMKPSNAAVLAKARIVFWVGPGLEAFLTKPLQTLGGNAKIVALADAPGLEKLRFREGGAFEAHDDGDDHAATGGHHQEDGEIDMHLWLDPKNAKAMAAEIERTLSTADGEHAALYRANLKALDTRLDALNHKIAETVAPVATKPFIVFHDAYQYFEHRYHVRVAGSITVSPETMPGAARLSDIHRKIGELGATCVFAEPQFEPRLVTIVLEGTPAKSGTLDPEGATLAAGPDLYFELMDGMAQSLKDCLSP